MLICGSKNHIIIYGSKKRSKKIRVRRLLIGEHSVEWCGIGGRSGGGSGKIATVGAGVGVNMVDQQGDAARHHHIIVFAVDGTETATQPFLKPTHFINGFAVVLHQQPLAHHRHQMIDDLRLREHIGLETHLEAVWFRFSPKHVAIFIFQAAKQISRLAVGSVRFERVALHHQQCLVVERGYGYRLFNEQIVVDMPTPLRHRFTNAVVAVDYRNHGIVGTGAASANVHTHHISAGEPIGGVYYPDFG